MSDHSLYSFISKFFRGQGDSGKFNNRSSSELRMASHRNHSKSVYASLRVGPLHQKGADSPARSFQV